ncbi:Por secretion system C-terminal sorting domain-containing protein [Bizionia echini]|uniref:Por secretion system C-terminal sorting domain-containing protein n=1 Tax=Bizionia echini TaxID=649333 RepID=A0A1I5CMX0_9FLAO|nr:endonuclease [Bizionia echini]SFN87981.1 Por secretion system C-terminal sorting domain-containing protein [Bizionia echini]
MKYNLLFILLFFIGFQSFSQIVINELDCDTPGIDDQEFLEIKSDVPNFNLDGYVVVFFNGSNSGGNSSYFTIDLDGYTTDENGLLLIGSDTVTPFPQLLIAANTIQNGADAVAIYQGSDFDFPEETVATIDNLIDVLIYDTSDSDDEDMIAIFSADPNFASIEQINEGPGNNTNSIQRNNDGTYTSTTPTPRALNDGSGIVFNSIAISTDAEQYQEGETILITFTSQTNVDSDATFSFSLSNAGFNTMDYTGSTTVTIPNGQNSVSTSITLVNDTEDEGDEEPVIKFVNLPSPYIPFNNFIKLRAIDDDFTVASFGTPLNSTFGNVTSTQPSGYYNSLDGLSDANLKQALQDIIADPSVVRAQTYADVIDILKEADQNPENSNEVWLVYLEQGRAKLDFQLTSDSNGKWNREHTFPRSRAGYYSIEEDEIADGKDIFWTTKADSLRHGNSDAHALRAVDGPENSSRNNQFYGEYTGPVGTLGGFKGDVARGVFYLAVRYNGLDIVNGYPDGNVGQFGDLQTLLEWHRNDPPDDFEMNRNNVIYTWQYNRNPFIDQPELIEYIWGDNIGETWVQPLSIDENSLDTVSVYPNPTTGRVYIKGLKKSANITVYSMDGRALFTKAVDNATIDLNLSSGMFLMQITSEDRTTIKKIMVN